MTAFSVDALDVLDFILLRNAEDWVRRIEVAFVLLCSESEKAREDS